VFFPRKGEDALLKPLHLAAYFNLQQTSEELISQKQIVNERSNCGRTPLNIACSLGHVDMVQLLLKHGADPNISDLQQTTCLHAASASGHEAVVAILLEHDKSLVFRKGLNNQTALHEAAFRGSVETVTTLLAQGCPLDSKLKDGRNAIHLAAYMGYPAIIKLIYEKDSAVTLNLFRQGEGSWGDRPIHSAAITSRLDVIKMLWKLGADLEARQIEGRTPLQIACQHGRPSSTLKLLQLGAAPDALDLSDMTPLHLAAQNGHKYIIKFLIPYSTGIRGYLELPGGPKGDTALHFAATSTFGPHYYQAIPKAVQNHTYLECFQLLCEANKSTMKAVSNAGETPMHLAATAGNLEIISFILDNLSDKDTHEVLQQTTFGDKQAPLHRAVTGGHVYVVRRLPEAGARPDQEDADGKTALQQAKTKDNEIFKLVLSYSKDPIGNESSQVDLYLS
jgi:ankyrin